MKVLYCGYIVFIVLTKFRCQDIRYSVECVSSIQHCSSIKHKIDCGHDSVIEILQATYGLKAMGSESDDEDIETESDDVDMNCCNIQSVRQYQQFNKSELLSLYRSCSGKSGYCEIQTGHSFKSNGLEATTSNIQYDCIKIENYKDLCNNNSAKFTYKNTHLVFRPDFMIPGLEGINACRCNIYAQQAFSMDVKTTDVRLGRLNIDGNPSNLSSSAVLEIKDNISKDSQVFHCSDNNVPTFEYSNIVRGTSVAIHLDKLHLTSRDDAPTVIWIQISKNSNEYVTINCSMKYNNDQITVTENTSTAIHTSLFWQTTETSLIPSRNSTSSVQFKKTTDNKGNIGMAVAIIISILVAVCIVIAALFCYRRKRLENGETIDTCYSADVTQHNNQTEPNYPENATVIEAQDTDKTYNTTREISSVQRVSSGTTKIYNKLNNYKEAGYDTIYLQRFASTANDTNNYNTVKVIFYDTTVLSGNPKSFQDNDMV